MWFDTEEEPGPHTEGPDVMPGLMPDLKSRVLSKGHVVWDRTRGWTSHQGGLLLISKQAMWCGTECEAGLHFRSAE
jgi:hypothetical protein